VGGANVDIGPPTPKSEGATGPPGPPGGATPGYWL